MIGREDVDATPPLWPPRVRPCSSNPDRRTRIESRTEIRKESSQLLGAMIMWFAGRDQHVQVHRRECCSMSRKAKSSFSAWFLLPDHLIRSLTPPCSRTTWATKRLSTANMSTRAAPASSPVLLHRPSTPSQNPGFDRQERARGEQT